ESPLQHLPKKRWLISRERLSSENLVQETNGRVFRFLYRSVSAGQGECAKVSRAAVAMLVNEKELPAPDRPIGSVSRSVPRHTQHGRLDAIVGDARQDVSVMVLNTIQGGVVRFRESCRVGCGGVVWMHVAGEVCWTSRIQILKVFDRLPECVECLFRLEIPNMLANEDIRVD